jgi:RNA polymerase sigma factor (sigma-70 family)
MTTAVEQSTDHELELFFASARRYPLLTAEDEQRIDQAKWTAAAAALETGLNDPAGARYFKLLLEHCVSHPPLVGEFNQREQHFILRRELVDLLPGGSHAARVEAWLSTATQEDTTLIGAELFDEVKAMQWPASLMVGVANALARQREPAIACQVADALQAWELQWPKQARAFRSAMTAAKHKRARGALKRYEQARDQLTLHNLRLVYTIAHRYRDKGVGLMDLIQEGAVGLMRAAEKYDHRTGFRFSTYAFNWIAQSVRRAVADRGSLIRYPAHVSAQLAKIYRSRAQSVARTGREPSLAELSEVTGIAAPALDELRQLSNFTVSADSPVFEDDGDSLLDRIDDSDSEALADSLDQRSLQRALLKEIAALDKDERIVIMGRWGLQQHRSLSRTELAEQLGVSREWVRQLELGALAKLRERPFLQAAIRDYGEAS